MLKNSILFDQGPLPQGSLFENPVSMLRADHPNEVAAVFAELEAAQQNGLWAAGFASYELGYCLTPKLAPLLPDNRETPLLHFGLYEGPIQPPPMVPTSQIARLGALEAAWGFAEYKEKFDRVHDYISAGDTYQVNLTFPLKAVCTSDPDALYSALKQRQKVAYGALVNLGDDLLLSRSPELFFKVDTDGVITTRPMKGTAPRGDTAARDIALRDWLAASEKNHAENLMIVDLLRNDMSRVCALGTVEVPSMFQIESYATVHQMTSRIIGQIKPETSLLEVFTALFPCGSITGAPKLRAMQIIAELEGRARGIYCGSIGWIAPDGRMEFNVAIRTLVLTQGDQVTLNVGGGVVYDSTAAAEYEEALLKAKFARFGD